MNPTTLILSLAATLALALAQNDQSPNTDTVDGICYPLNSTQSLDLNAPCNENLLIALSCIYGANDTVLAEVTRNISSSTSVVNHLARQNNGTQRACFCESQFFVNDEGCSACYTSHGVNVTTGLTREQRASASSSYCAASATPTLAFVNFFSSVKESIASATPHTGNVPSIATTVDPLGNRTDVSLYWTPSVTGSAAWGGGGAAAATTTTPYASLDVVSGQIVATASANVKDASSSSSAAAASTTTSGTSSVASPSTSSTKSGNDAGARQTAAMGVLGIAGLALFL